MHQITVGEGSPEGTNRAYLLSERRVVIDPGPPSDAAWSLLVEGIREAGLRVTDVEGVFLTHWHADHVGLGPKLSERADAPIYMHEGDAPLVAEYATQREQRVDRDGRRLDVWGVSKETIESVLEQDEPSPLPDSVPVRSVADGNDVFGLEVIHTPGHTLGHAALAGEDDLFVGDAVLPTYTPNVGGSDTRVDRPLETYLGTLDGLATREETAYPGHSSDLSLAARIDEIRTHHQERSERVIAAVAESEPATPWEVATRLFGEMHGVHVKMGAGEAAAHLSALASVGRLERVSLEPQRYVTANDSVADGIRLPSDRT